LTRLTEASDLSRQAVCHQSRTDMKCAATQALLKSHLAKIALSCKKLMHRIACSGTLGRKACTTRLYLRSVQQRTCPFVESTTCFAVQMVKSEETLTLYSSKMYQTSKKTLCGVHRTLPKSENIIDVLCLSKMQYLMFVLTPKSDSCHVRAEFRL
jgi:hypothetical protein